MSGYFKKILLLRKNDTIDSPVILQSESSSHGVSIKLKSSVVFAENKDLSLALSNGDDVIILGIKDEQFTTLDLSKRLCAGIFDGEKLLYFGASDTSFNKQNFILKYKSKRLIIDEKQQAEITKTYDDEQLAEENYYDNRLISEDLYADKEQDDRNEDTCRQDQEEAKHAQSQTEIPSDEACATTCEGANSGQYFESAQSKLVKLFESGTRFPTLENVIPHSKWVKINYTIDKYYVVGIVEKDFRPHYICYGIPGTYQNPPEKLKGLASFIPSSLFNLCESGFFVMFQSALSGKRIVPSIDIFGL